jgi:hypothetical protein
VTGNSESGDMNVVFSENLYMLAVKNTIEVRTTMAKDTAYSKTTIELRFDLNHEKKIFVKIPIRIILKP